MFQSGKEMVINQIKKKIIVAIVPATPYLLLALGGLLVIIMLVTPALKTLEYINTFSSKITPFFEKVGNMLSGREFQIIDIAVVEEKEEEFNKKLSDYYDDYLKVGVEIDAPLIMATVYYPLSVAYDEETIIDLNELDAPGDQEDQYDLWTKKIKKLKTLIEHSVSITATEYECNKYVTTNNGETTESYVRGNQVGTPVNTYPFDGDFKDDGSCTSTSSIKLYTYQREEIKYDDYLKTTYILASPEFELNDSLTGAAKDNELEQTVIAIHDLAKLYNDIFEDSSNMLGGVSALCPLGLTVTGSSDAGTYSLEEYVAGVVSAENNYVDNNDPANIESMKAQAIAARTYAITQTDYCSKSIDDSSGSQNFTKTISDKARQATSATGGMVLTYNDNVFMSEYDSFDCAESCISGQDCSCTYIKEPFIDSSGKTTWDASKAVNTHVITIPTGSGSFGIGGHGHGMSQIVANSLQRQGWTYDKILSYFYADGVEITQFVGGENGQDGSLTVVDGVFNIPSGVNSGLDGSKGSAPGGLNIYFWNRLSALFDAAAAAGYDHIGMTDTWRPYSVQVTCKIEKPDLCATPGKSLHGWGIAADLNYYKVDAAQKWIHDHAIEYGLEFPMSYEPWHIQPIAIKYV